MTDMEAIRAGLANGTMTLEHGPESPEIEEARAWCDWLWLSTVMMLRAAWAFGLVAAWKQWASMTAIAVDYWSRREAIFASMIRLKMIQAPTLFIRLAK